jgi:plastocyanin
MRHILKLRALGAAAAILAIACAETVAPDEVFDVYTPGNVFSPFSLTVPVGAVVRYNISGEPHNVIFDAEDFGRPADINIVQNVVVNRTFAVAGTFDYKCTVHNGMIGEIIVE